MSEVGARGKGKATARGRGRQDKLACAEALDKAEQTTRDSHFRAAQEWFAQCARPGCGRALRHHCAALYREVSAALPSVLPVVTNAIGTAGQDIEVKMDGETLTSNLDGTSIVVDPGDHEFTFLKEGEVFATRRLAVEKGQRNQIVSVSFQSRKHASVAVAPTVVAEEAAAEPAPQKKPRVEPVAAETEPVDEEPAPRVVRRTHARRASEEPERETGAPFSAYAWAGVGVLGIGGYGAFTLKGRADNDALVQNCKPNCNPTSVKHVRNTYLAADISLGLGLAALAVSTYLFVNTDSPEESPRSRTSHISGVAVEPTASGALATVGGTF